MKGSWWVGLGRSRIRVKQVFARIDAFDVLFGCFVLVRLCEAWYTFFVLSRVLASFWHGCGGWECIPKKIEVFQNLGPKHENQWNASLCCKSGNWYTRFAAFIHLNICQEKLRPACNVQEKDFQNFFKKVNYMKPHCHSSEMSNLTFHDAYISLLSKLSQHNRLNVF